MNSKKKSKLLNIKKDSAHGRKMQYNLAINMNKYIIRSKEVSWNNHNNLN